jgi:C_GCAxxG_C_C family probable redox protein
MLASLADLLAAAEHKGYALALVSADDLLAAQALIAQASDQEAPLALLVHTGRLSELSSAESRRLADALREQARMARVPVCPVLAGVTQLNQVAEAVRLGFCAVLLENDEAAFVQESVGLAHQKGLSVVARIRDSAISAGPAALLVEMGGAVPLDEVAALCRAAPVPILLRPGAALPAPDLERVLAPGLRGIDCTPMLSEALAVALRERACAPGFDPHALLDLRNSILRETLAACLKVTGSAGQAPYAPIDIPAYAMQLFEQGYTCAEAIFIAFAEAEGYSSEVAHRAATSFIGGIGNQGQVCGTLIGGLMVIGVREAHTNPQHKPPRYAARALAVELLHWYQAQKGSTNCRDLLQLDLSDPEQAGQFSMERHFHGVCMPLMRETSEWLVARFARLAEESST